MTGSMRMSEEKRDGWVMAAWALLLRWISIITVVITGDGHGTAAERMTYADQGTFAEPKVKPVESSLF